MAHNLQDSFFFQAKKDGIPLTIYLLNGFQIKGIIRGYDTFTLTVEDQNGGIQLVFKHAISTINAGKKIRTNTLFKQLSQQEESIKDQESTDEIC